LALRPIAIYATIVLWLFNASAAQAQLPADAVWIDVRTPAEYASGHLPQALLIPFDSIEVGVAELGLAKGTPIYLYCAVGGRAEKARQSLQALGYTNVTNVGGLDNARQVAGEAAP
jgi:phage shock protein E